MANPTRTEICCANHDHSLGKDAVDFETGYPIPCVHGVKVAIIELTDAEVALQEAENAKWEAERAAAEAEATAKAEAKASADAKLTAFYESIGLTPEEIAAKL